VTHRGEQDIGFVRTFIQNNLASGRDDVARYHFRLPIKARMASAETTKTTPQKPLQTASSSDAKAGVEARIRAGNTNLIG